MLITRPLRASMTVPVIAISKAMIQAVTVLGFAGSGWPPWPRIRRQIERCTPIACRVFIGAAGASPSFVGVAPLAAGRYSPSAGWSRLRNHW